VSRRYLVGIISSEEYAPSLFSRNSPPAICGIVTVLVCVYIGLSHSSITS